METIQQNCVLHLTRQNRNVIFCKNQKMGHWKLIVGCKNTVLPNSVTQTGGSAFESCSGLKSITIQNSVTEIKSDAFYYNGSDEEWKRISFDNKYTNEYLK